MKKYIYLFVLFFLFALPEAVFPMGENPIKDTTENKKDTSFHGRRFLVLPFIYQSPETSIGAGVAGGYFFKTAKEHVRTSSVTATALYTWNQQTVLTNQSTIFFPNEKYIVNYLLTYANFPDRFWGIGNRTPDANEQRYTYKQLYFRIQPVYRFHRRWFGGLYYEYQNVIDIKQTGDNPQTFNGVTGNTGGISSGLGPLVYWDSRNNAFWPTKGELLYLTSFFFRSYLGSQFIFSSYIVDARKFIKLNKHEDILALQLYGNFTSNGASVPFRELPGLGGPYMLRGYWINRFRDNQMLTAQVEYRRWIWWRFGAVAFASVGQVGRTISNFNLAGLHAAGGLGVRFALVKNDKFNLRFDFGVGNKSSGFYINFMEAF